MCISNAKARFTNTKGYVGRTKNNTIVMAYQMEAQSIGEGIRAIILQIPAKKIIKVHDTSQYANFLNEISDQIGNAMFSSEFGIMYSRSLSKNITNLACEKVGMYDVVTLNSWEDFKCLENIFPKGKCPEIQSELIEFYQKNYPHYKYIVATFDNKKPMSAQPFMVEYEGLLVDGENLDDNGNIKEVFHFPAVDNGDDNGIHSGIPVLDTFHREDHLICFPHEKGLQINFSQNVPTKLISNKIGWFKKTDKTKNGDFLVAANGNFAKKVPVQNIGCHTLEQMYDHPNINTHKNNLNSYTNW